MGIIINRLKKVQGKFIGNDLLDIGVTDVKGNRPAFQPFQLVHLGGFRLVIPFI